MDVNTICLSGKIDLAVETMATQEAIDEDFMLPM
jgi:hypothetical protein